MNRDGDGRQGSTAVVTAATCNDNGNSNLKFGCMKSGDLGASTNKTNQANLI